MDERKKRTRDGEAEGFRVGGEEPFEERRLAYAGRATEDERAWHRTEGRGGGRSRD